MKSIPRRTPSPTKSPRRMALGRMGGASGSPGPARLRRARRQSLIPRSRNLRPLSPRRELSLDPVVDPVRVPPLDWIHGDALHQHAEMQMIAASEPRRAALAHDLAALDGVARLDVDAREVRVERHQAVAMIDHHRVAVDAEILGKHDDAVVAGLDGMVRGDGEIEAEMVLMIDDPAVVDVAAVVGKGRFDLGVAELREGAVPEPLGPRAAGHLDEIRGVEAAQAPVDLEEVLDEVVLARDLRGFGEDRG